MGSRPRSVALPPPLRKINRSLSEESAAEGLARSASAERAREGDLA